MISTSTGTIEGLVCVDTHVGTGIDVSCTVHVDKSRRMCDVIV